jgi:hypothetical protein
MTLYWNKENISNTALNAGSINTSNKSFYAGKYVNSSDINNVRPVVSIFAGTNKTVLDNPIENSGKIFFSSDFSYFQSQRVVETTITIPARNLRTTTTGSNKGKGGGTYNNSYNGYADYYIHRHNFGNPIPAFAVYVTEDAINAELAGHAITGSMPLQFASPNSFRLALVYATPTYLVLRERYQVYDTQLPQKQLKIRIYYFSNTSGVNSVSV